MLNPPQLETLSRIPSPVLTAYINTQPAQQNRHRLVPGYLLWLEKEAKAIARDLPPAEQERFREQFERIRRFLGARKNHEKSLVFFAGPATWETASLQLEVKNELCWGRISLAQLLRLLCQHKSQAVVVVDKSGARFLRYRLGEMAAIEEYKYEIDISQWRKKDLGHYSRPGIRKTRGSQHDVFDRRLDAQYARLCRETAERATDLCRKERLSGPFLVGPQRLTESIKACLPGEFRAGAVLVKENRARLSVFQLQQCLAPALAEWKCEQDSALVTALLNGGRDRVVGIEATLDQIQKAGIHTLLLTQDADTNLLQCVSCGRIDRSSDPLCPGCGVQRCAVTLREVLPDLVLRHKMNVEVLSGNAAEKLAEAGGIGAWLRPLKQAQLKRAARR